MLGKRHAGFGSKGNVNTGTPGTNQQIWATSLGNSQDIGHINPPKLAPGLGIRSSARLNHNQGFL
jgi:hypothetical protein